MDTHVRKPQIHILFENTFQLLTIHSSIQNIARKIPNVQSRDAFLGKVDEALKPFIEDMGYDWEYSVDETDRNLWKIQGLVPPMPRSEAEREWASGNRPVPYDPVQGGLL